MRKTLKRPSAVSAKSRRVAPEENDFVKAKARTARTAKPKNPLAPMPRTTTMRYRPDLYPL